MPLISDLTANFMGASTNRNRSSAIPISINGKFLESDMKANQLASSILEMDQRLDQFVATELLSGKGDESILEIGRRVIASGAGAALMQARKNKINADKRYSDAVYRQLIADLKSRIAQIDIKIRETENTITEAQRDIDMLANRITVLREVQSDLRSDKITVLQAMEHEEVRFAISNWEEREGEAFDPQAENARTLLQDIIIEEQTQLDTNGISKNEQSIVDNTAKLKGLKADRANLSILRKQLNVEYGYSSTSQFSSAAERVQYEEKTDAVMSDIFENVVVTKIIEQNDAITFLQSILHLKGDKQNYIAEIDSFIAGENPTFNADEMSFAKLSKDTTLNKVFRERLTAELLKKNLASLENHKGKPEYISFVKMIAKSTIPKDLYNSVISSTDINTLTGVNLGNILESETKLGNAQMDNSMTVTTPI